MSLFDPLPWDSDTPPAFTNDEGVKWWPDRASTQWAHKEDQHGTKLPHVTVWFVARPDGYQTRIILNGQSIEYESQVMEHIGAHIDMMKVAARFAP